MRKVMMVLVLVCLLAIPAMAQEDADGDGITDCPTTFDDVRQHLADAEAATDQQARLEAINEARVRLIVVQVYCLGYTMDEAVGLTRMTPVPAGVYDLAEIEFLGQTSFSGVVTVTDFRRLTNEDVLAANQFNDVAPDGMVYVAVTLNAVCGEAMVLPCELNKRDWSLVGSAGRVYDYQIATGIMSDDFELFGGGSGDLVLTYIVGADETDFVVFNGEADEPTFLAVE